MTYTYHYDSPLGGITLASNGTELTGLWFDGQKYFGDTLAKDYEEKRLPVLEQTVRWLDIYFLRPSARFHTAAVYADNAVPQSRMGNHAGHSFRKDDDLW